VWTPAHVALIRAAAKDPEVARIFVNAAIKKALCRDAGSDRAWLSKVQPWWGHDYHFHVRLNCPADSPQCEPQPPRPSGDGCSSKDLDPWFTEAMLHPKPSPFPVKPKPSRPRASGDPVITVLSVITGSRFSLCFASLGRDDALASEPTQWR